MSDGLSQLAQRGRRTREIPPPRHPARTAPVQLSAVPEPTEADVNAAAPAPKARSATSSTKPVSREAAPAAVTKAKADLKVVTVYLEEDDDTFLETITHTGRTSQPKTAISRSAVVRLALERLHDQMTPEQIVHELRPRGDTTSTGRKRR